jgi:hypothetical protein
VLPREGSHGKFLYRGATARPWWQHRHAILPAADRRDNRLVIRDPAAEVPDVPRHAVCRFATVYRFGVRNCKDPVASSLKNALIDLADFLSIFRLNSFVVATSTPGLAPGRRLPAVSLALWTVLRLSLRIR